MTKLVGKINNFVNDVYFPIVFRLYGFYIRLDGFVLLIMSFSLCSAIE